MSAFLREWGIAATIVVPMIKASARDFAVSADWTPATGDVKISKDGGTLTNIATLPSIWVSGAAGWLFSLSSTETQAAKIWIQVIDSATKAVEDQALLVETYASTVAGSTASQHPAIGSSTFKKNAARASIMFFMTDNTPAHAPAAGKVVTVTRSLDNGAFGAGTISNIAEHTSTGLGWYKFDAAAADMNGNCIAFRCTASGCDDTNFEIFTQP